MKSNLEAEGYKPIDHFSLMLSKLNQIVLSVGANYALCVLKSGLPDTFKPELKNESKGFSMLLKILSQKQFDSTRLQF